MVVYTAHNVGRKNILKYNSIIFISLSSSSTNCTIASFITVCSNPMIIEISIERRGLWSNEEAEVTILPPWHTNIYEPWIKNGNQVMEFAIYISTINAWQVSVECYRILNIIRRSQSWSFVHTMKSQKKYFTFPYGWAMRRLFIHLEERYRDISRT